jgi:glycosyltransferase involved in cell wall biosynthesis
VVKPNFVHPAPEPAEHEGDYALFVGRLSSEKGIRTLLWAWRMLKGVPLRVVGDGPLREELEGFAEREKLKDVEVLGRKPREEVLHLMREAQILVFPSEWYEGLPLTIAEAFACGLPVIASRLGAMAEIVEEERTGLLFGPGDAQDLAAKVEWAWLHPKEMAEMGRQARREYEAKYTAERNYEMLMDVYRIALERARPRS